MVEYFTRETKISIVFYLRIEKKSISRTQETKTVIPVIYEKLSYMISLPNWTKIPRMDIQHLFPWEYELTWEK